MVTKLQQLLQQNAIDIYKTNFQTTTLKNYLRSNKIHIYPSQTCLERQINLQEPLAIISRVGVVKEFFAIWKLNNTFITVPIIFDDSNGFHNCNLWFAPVSIQITLATSFVSLEDIGDVEYLSGLLVISKSKTSTGLDKTGYALVTSEWTVRKQNGTLELPLISKELFGI